MLMMMMMMMTKAKTLDALILLKQSPKSNASRGIKYNIKDI